MWSRKLADESNTDTVFIEKLALAANIGADCWGRIRSQPIIVSVLLHVARGYLNSAADDDDFRESVSYSSISKAVVKLVDAPGATFDGPVGLARAVTLVSLEQAEESAIEVEVHVEVPKWILMASTFRVEMRTGTSNWGMKPFSRMEVFMDGLVFHITIGGNPQERLLKQQVLTRIRCLEQEGNAANVDYPSIVRKIYENIQDAPEYGPLTLEKFVMDVIRNILHSSEAIDLASVQARKPSALPFAVSSGVQITRCRTELPEGMVM